MSFDAVQAAVQTGTVDLGLSGFSWTAQRAENYFITDWYEAGKNETQQVTITLAANKDKFKTAADYNGVKVGAQGASLQKILCEEQLKGAQIELYENLNDACTDLLTGKIDALAVAYGNGESFISANGDKIVFTGFEFVVDELYKNNVILLKKNSTELGAKVNAVLAKAKAAGVYDSWYEACQLLAEIKTIDELGYDEEGNKITE
jgi:polar amino acid transport system substrate-binding protein